MWKTCRLYCTLKSWVWYERWLYLLHVHMCFCIQVYIDLWQEVHNIDYPNKLTSLLTWLLVAVLFLDALLVGDV